MWLVKEATDTPPRHGTESHVFFSHYTILPSLFFSIPEGGPASEGIWSHIVVGSSSNSPALAISSKHSTVQNVILEVHFVTRALLYC